MTVVDAVVLAGGRARRLGGIDKALLPAGGSTLLAGALAAVADARRRVVVGPVRQGFPPDVVWVREAPPHGGPVAALAVGLEALLASGTSAPLVVVLATDLPSAPAAVAALRAPIGGTGAAVTDDAGSDDARSDAVRSHDPGQSDGWVAVDPDGYRQPLLAVYRTASLARALGTLRARRGTVAGAAVRDLLSGLRLVEVPLPAALTADVDTPEQRDALLGQDGTSPTRSGASRAPRPDAPHERRTT